MPPIISAFQAKGQLTREQLYAMTKTQVVTAYSIRFGNPSQACTATKEAIIDTYMVKAASTPSMALATHPPIQIFKVLQLTTMWSSERRLGLGVGGDCRKG